MGGDYRTLQEGSATVAILRSVLCVVILLAATASHGVGQVFAGPQGPVEFIGLERWNAQELFEAIRQTAPDQPLQACAVVMKGPLGFADAGVFTYTNADSPEQLRSDDIERYTVIVGIEDSARVRYRTVGNETIDLPESWQALKSVAEKDLGTLHLATELSRLRNDPERMRQLTEAFGFDVTALDRVWELIEAVDGEQDRLLAHAILANDASWSSRAAAASVLVNFSEHDAAWHDLVSSTIDPEARVSGAAIAVLRGWILAERGRSVRWNAAREPLMALLDGTNPFAFQTVLRVLAATGINPAFGRQLIREAPDLLLAYVGAEHEMTRESAFGLFKTVSGEDFGANPEAWSDWLNGPPDDS